ncbi:RNA polymerase sigma factor [Hoylesella loescheii]|jgi:RNA polymerase sigma factor, sigma-70 family|uniref:RNA polymerase sigma-70 factor n=1 Tax=Hoylesella loescheii DSM 19665 = JCM 12249 = ATCC 15930 TaxID=1122985 RepID=A0A069QFZ8_HOYLO|nr:sigma-70 family RNA polymerase sigma factor [Hoylesella loescheii]KDR51793.1 RNA polymerase sigma-70 factor [Hoylesella loescheii DSM 19665 = JCM 12249 = ATCC 15930]
MRENEERYVAALKEGSREAFTMLYNLYADRLYSFALVQTKSKQMAEDVVQDTFLKLWNNRTNLNCYGNVQALVFTMARNLIIDAFRRQVANIDIDAYFKLHEALPSTASPEESLYFNETKEHLEQAKAKLSNKECKIYEMSREQDMPIKKIAQTLNLSPQTVKNYLTSTLKVFRSQLRREQLLWLLSLLPMV